MLCRKVRGYIVNNKKNTCFSEIFNVDPSSTYQVVNALVKAGKDFELVVLPGVHHTLGENFGEHKRYDFFVRNLLGVTPPKWNDIKK